MKRSHKFSNDSLNPERDEQLESLNAEILRFNGHQNILGTHYNTLELTSDGEISRRADCIIGVNSDKACFQLGANLKKHIREGGGLKFELRVNKELFTFFGRGSKGLTLEDPKEIVFRKSHFESSRTAAISCSAAAIDIPKHLIKLLKQPSQEGTLAIIPFHTEPEDDLSLFAALP